MVKKEIEEWLSKANKDLEEAKFLFEQNRPLEDSAYFIHQAIEKYLKAFLIFNGWELEKIHDLVKLTKDAAKFDKSFEKFIPVMEEITDFYIESRYPVGYEVEYTKEEIEKSIKDAEAIKSLVIEKILKGKV
jgi:HEPN domain-containing protein